ncbi:MAG: AraC family transcriptional regulator [Clostridiales bacterium]|nr:AraC family transcriptional regulator [Clostridiales bacterium]
MDLCEMAIEYARRWKSVCAMDVAVFDYACRAFLPGAESGFCHRCKLEEKGRCHSYSCFEAERWNGLFVYFCPLSLAFVSTVIFKERTAQFALVSGPFVMGDLEDALGCDSLMAEEIMSLPRKSPDDANSLSMVQWAMCMHLSGRGIEESGEASKSQTNLHNTLYDLAMEMGGGRTYPLETENKLQQMIKTGDKRGAQELINQLFGAMYFATADFSQIKQRARELVVLFSRAAIEGGADVGQVFGKNRDCLAEVEMCQTIESLSMLLSLLFHRFVGYVFDFAKFEHKDVMRKTLTYIRENLAGKLTVEECAERAGLSRSYFSTLFKSEMGIPFNEYVNGLRIEKSKGLLLSTTLSIAGIADLAGYSDQSYFTKKFLQLTGVTPGHYRKNGGSV